MRIYLPPALSSLLSMVSMVIALAIAVFLGFKAWEIYSQDPSLQQLPDLLEKSQS